MAHDLETFSGTIGGYGITIRKNVNSLIKRVAVAVLDEIVRDTPADTGAARSNWLCSIVEENTDVVPPHAPGRHLGLSETANYAQAVHDGTAIIQTRQSGQDVIIQNNLDYMSLLNDGSSKQAPANFVESAIQAGARVVDNAQVLVGPTQTV